MIKKYYTLLREHGYDDVHAHQVIGWLVQHIKNKDFVGLLSQPLILSGIQERQLQKFINELLIDKKPLQYILGSVLFCGLELFVEPPVLIPRPETEEWVSELIDFLKSRQPLKILDLCTGSGCIALALAKNLPQSKIVGADISSEALALAEKNRRSLVVDNVLFVRSDLFENIQDKGFDVIVANPPYISEYEWFQLDSVVKNWEDKRALVAGDQGLTLIKKIIQEGPNYFKKDSLSLLVLEIGFSQAEEVCTFMRSCGYTDVKVQRDLAGLDRVVMGR